MIKKTDIISIHMAHEKRRRFQALAAYMGLDASQLGERLITEFLDLKEAELRVLQEVFNVEGSTGSLGSTK